MIENFDKKNRKNDIILLSIIIFVFLFVVWLFTPPGNKLAQICLYGNRTQFLISKLTKTSQELNEWKFHRNNAVYLARMESKKAALKEIDMAVMTVPSQISELELNSLYLDRAEIRLFFGEYKSALDDFLKIKEPGITDRLKIALLYKNIGNNKYALSYCNSIINTDPTAYIGYACMADVYAGAGRYDVSVKVYNWLIDRSQERARYFSERAAYKKKMGDIDGYNDDINKAKELSSSQIEDFSIIKDTLKPKKLLLDII